MLIKLTKKVDKYSKMSDEEITQYREKNKNTKDQGEWFKTCFMSQDDIRNNLNVEPYILNTNRVTDISEFHFSLNNNSGYTEGAKTVLRIGKITIHVIESVEEIASLSKAKIIRNALIPARAQEG